MVFSKLLSKLGIRKNYVLYKIFPVIILVICYIYLELFQMNKFELMDKDRGHPNGIIAAENILKKSACYLRTSIAYKMTKLTMEIV